jgi:hypothetical protein
MTTAHTEIERAAAMALLDRGIAFRLPAPWLLRLFGKKKLSISVKRLRLGTLLHLSAIAEMGTLEPLPVDDDRAAVISEMAAEPLTLPIKVIAERRKEVALKVACCLLNSRIKIKLLSRPLARYLRWAVHPDQLQELVMWLFVYGRAESFTTTTKLLRRMTMTMPRNLGQE